MSTTEDAISHTKKWLSSFVIEHNICPFAKREYDNDSIHYEVVLSDKLENQLQELIYSCEQLDNNEAIETSLLILSKGLLDFDDFLDFLALSNDLMHKQGYESIYQLASFHPDYSFDGVDAEDASNFTNRSPYPMLHLIREASLEKVLTYYPNPEDIPSRNIEYTRELGVALLQKLLASCKQT